jgi:predicted membrane channel-forming protein YqfA (hemolysin III family)
MALLKQFKQDRKEEKELFRDYQTQTEKNIEYILALIPSVIVLLGFIDFSFLLLEGSLTTLHFYRVCSILFLGAFLLLPLISYYYHLPKRLQIRKKERSSL